MTSICNFNHQNMFVCQQELIIKFAIQSFYLKFPLAFSVPLDMLVGGLFQFDASFSFMRNVYDII